jgi:pSer/pThr/pTyr-binding forkhead associated (FHA) protein
MGIDHNGIYIEDLASTNGTWMKCKADQYYEIKEGDEFRIAN